jgi:uncharacterized protein with HEPN domain
MRDALEHIRVLRLHVAEFGLENQLGLDAASLRLAVAIDCLNHLPPDLREALVGDEWHALRAMRNRIAHGYISVDADVVRDTVRHDLDPLERALREAYDALSARA